MNNQHYQVDIENTNLIPYIITGKDFHSWAREYERISQPDMHDSKARFNYKHNL